MTKIFLEGVNRIQLKKETNQFLFIMYIIFIIFLAFVQIPSKIKAEESIQITYYYFSNCEGCTEGEAFEQDLRLKLQPVISEDEYDIELKNIFKEEVFEEFLTITNPMMTDTFVPSTPLLIVDDYFLFGIDEIENLAVQTVEAINRKQTNPKNIESSSKLDSNRDSTLSALSSLQNIPEDTSYFVYFSVPSCSSCDKVDLFLQSLEDEFTVGEKMSELKINKLDMSEMDNIPLAHWFFNQYHVPEQKQKAPVLFYQNGYLQGHEEINKKIIEVIESGQALGWENINSEEIAKKQDQLLPKDLFVLFVTGFINGLSPCGLSILLFLISLLLVRRNKILQYGLAFIAARIIVFLLFGLVFYQAIGFLDTAIFQTLLKTVKLIFAVIFIIFSILNFSDCIMAYRGQYGKIRFQLPKGVREFQQVFLEKILGKNEKYLLALVFLAGLVVSAAEFLCTGQLYLATILYTINKVNGFSITLVIIFLVYLITMNIPSVIITILVQKGSQVFHMTEYARKNLPLIKLIYGAIFLVFAIIMIVWMV